MSYWLIVYDRQAGRLYVQPQEFADSSYALRVRCEVERRLPGLEVVVLGAESLDQLRVTHSRYFGGPFAA